MIKRTFDALIHKQSLTRLFIFVICIYINYTEMLPPIPWWTCMVDSTLEFCRIGWGTASKEFPEVCNHNNTQS